MSIASSGETHAKKTATPEREVHARNRASAVSSSVLLMHFAHALWSEKIHPPSDVMLLGPGDDFDPSLSRLVTLACPSDCEPVALGLSTSVTGCSCSVRYPTPTRSDRKGMSSKKWRLQRPGKTGFVRFTDVLGGVPHPDFLELVMGFPEKWTETEPSETP